MDKSKERQFFEEILEVYKKYNLSIAHEDHGGAFIIDDYSENNIKWLEQAVDVE